MQMDIETIFQILVPLLFAQGFKWWLDARREIRHEKKQDDLEAKRAAAWTEERAEHRRQIEWLQGQINERIRSEAHERRDSMQPIRSTLERLQLQNDQQQKEMTQLHAELKERGDENNLLRTEREKLRAEIAELRAEVSKLRQALATYQAQKRGGDE